MAGRTATAVKSKTKSKPRTAAKATTAKVKKKATAKASETKVTAKKAAAKESEATAEVAKPRARRTKKAETRTRIYWAVFNQSLKRVAVFEFDQKGEAEKRAAKLMKSSGEHHFIQKIKATVQV